MCSSPSSSDKQTESSPCTDILTSSFWIFEQCCTVFAFIGILLTQNKSSSHSQVAICEMRPEFHTCFWSICQLCPQPMSANLLLEVSHRWTLVLFLGNAPDWCRSVSLSEVFLCLTIHQTNAFTSSSGGIAENNWEAGNAGWTLPCYFVYYSLARSLDRICLW